MSDDARFWEWRDLAMRHPEGRAHGGEPCVMCSRPVPANAHWKHRDRHVCGPRCNANLNRRFNRMREGARTPAGVVVPASPEPRPNPRTRAWPAHFDMIEDPFTPDFDGYGPTGGDRVTRFGSTTHYLVLDPEGLRQVLLGSGLVGADAVDWPGLMAMHDLSRTAMVLSATSPDLAPGRLIHGLVNLAEGHPPTLVAQQPAADVHPGSDGRAFRWRHEFIRHVDIDGVPYTWEAPVCLPVTADHPGTWWSPAYRERSERLRRVSRATGAHSRRLRLEAGAAERFDPREVFERDGWVCGLCFSAIDPDLRWPDPLSASLDHVLPLVAGGEHTRANTQAAHLQCNIRKGAGTGATQ